jgi:type IV secretion system protein VirB9
LLKENNPHKDGTFYYTYNENWVYEIYAQPYHLTDIILEEGEYVFVDPLLSEDESVWELTANVAINPDNGLQIQYLFSEGDTTPLKVCYYFQLQVE